MGSSSRTSSIAYGDRQSYVEFQYKGPTKYCKHKIGGCKVKVVRRTSWTDDNPGRRFFGCRFYSKIPLKNKDCGYFEWYDEPMGGRAKALLNMLKDGGTSYEAEKVEDGSFELAAELGEIWEKLRRMKKMHLKHSEALKKEKKKVKVAYFVAILSWLILFAIVFG